MAGRRAWQVTDVRQAGAGPAPRAARPPRAGRLPRPNRPHRAL